jgi:hypothetical protein
MTNPAIGRSLFKTFPKVAIAPETLQLVEWRRRFKSEAGGGLKVKHPDADYQPF